MTLLSECLMDNFGIPIHGSLEIDQDVLIGIVDALGGIDTEEGKLGGAEVCAYQYASLPEESLYAPAERQITILKANPGHLSGSANGPAVEAVRYCPSSADNGYG